jgi:hypothetical protein
VSGGIKQVVKHHWASNIKIQGMLSKHFCVVVANFGGKWVDIGGIWVKNHRFWVILGGNSGIRYLARKNYPFSFQSSLADIG